MGGTLRNNNNINDNVWNNNDNINNDKDNNINNIYMYLFKYHRNHSINDHSFDWIMTINISN